MHPTRRHWVLSGLAAVAPPRLQAAPWTLRVPGPREAGDRRNEAIDELIVLLFDAAGQAVRLAHVPGLTQPRQLIELQAGRLDLCQVASVAEELPQLRVLRQPLRRGLLGLRLLLARADRAPQLAEVRQLDELRRWPMGYGSDWSDLRRMQDLGFQVVQGASYQGLFRMLAQGRFDWMHRGVNEVWAELDGQRGSHPLVVVPRIALFYPLDDYLAVQPQRPELLELLRVGYARMRRDGRYAAWFRRWYGPALQRARIPQRQVLHLAGYGVPPDTPLQAFDALHLAPSQGELTLP